jgi:hypothetical protein
MTDETTVPAVTGGDLQAAERLEGSHFTAAVYGSILVTTVIASFAMADQSADRAALFVAIAMFTYWLAHVWAGFVGARVHHQGRVGMDTVRRLGRKEWPIAEAAVVPLVVLLGHHLGLYGGEFALDLALAACVLQLFGWGVAAARATQASWPFALLNGGVDAGFGVVIVVLELLVH